MRKLMTECPLCKHIFEIEPDGQTAIGLANDLVCPNCSGKIGYWDNRKLEALGNTALVRKGTRYHSCKDGEYHVTKKTYEVKINHWLNGSHSYEYDDGCSILKIHSNPTISWAGAGGYWYRADINQPTIEFLKGEQNA